MADALRRLREIRDQLYELDAQREDLTDSRNHLIRQAVRERRSERDIAVAAGLNRSRIGQIARAGPG